MLTALSAKGIRNGVNQEYIDIDINGLSIVTLYTIYRKIYVTVTLNNNTSNKVVDIKSLPSSYLTSTSTIFVLFRDNVFTYTALDSIPKINLKSAKFRDAFRANYRATPVHPLYGEDSAPEDRSALLLTRENPVTSYAEFNRYCLVTINGYYHLSDTNEIDGILVYDAMDTNRKSNQNQIGIVSFRDICSIDKLPLTQSMIYKQSPTEKYSVATYIKLNTDLTNKSVLMSIGGYLQVVDNLFITQVGADMFKLDFSNYPILDRFFESCDYLNLSSLNLYTTPNNPSQISIEDITSDEAILQLLLLTQTFFIVLDTPQLFTFKKYIKKTGFPGMFISYEPPIFPLVTGLGRQPEYFPTKEDGQYAVNVVGTLVEQKIYNTTNPLQLNSVADSNKPTDPAILSGAYFLQIGIDV